MEKNGVQMATGRVVFPLAALALTKSNEHGARRWDRLLDGWIRQTELKSDVVPVSVCYERPRY